VSVGPLAAQSPPPLGLITLEQALDEATRHNPDLLAERANVDIAQAGIVSARLRPNPIISSSADHLDWVGMEFSELNGGGPPEYSVRADYLLERGGKRDSRIRAAEGTRQVASWEARDALRVMRLEVSNAFTDVLLAKSSAQLARENLAFMQQIVDIDAARVRSGDLPEVELARARLASRQMENAARDAEARVATAAVRLYTLLGRTGPPPPSFDAIGELAPARVTFSLEDLQRQAREQRPDLIAARRRVERADAEIAVQQALAVPDCTIGSEFRRQQGVNGRSNSLGVFLSVPIPLSNRNQGEIERAMRERQQAEARARAVEAAIVADLQTAWLAYQAAGARLDAIEQHMLQEARRVRDVTEYAYRRGSASLLELLDANRAFNETMQDYNDARAQYAHSLQALEAASAKGGQ